MVSVYDKAQSGTFLVQYMEGYKMEQKVKQDQKIVIGHNIRRIRLSLQMKQVELVRMFQLQGVSLTRETLVKIERGTHHISATQLQCFRDCLQTSYEELLKETV